MNFKTIKTKAREIRDNTEFGEWGQTYQEKIIPMWNEVDLLTTTIQELYDMTQMVDYLIGRSEMAEKLLQSNNYSFQFLGHLFSGYTPNSEVEKMADEYLPQDVAKLLIDNENILVNAKFKAHTIDFFLSIANSERNYKNIISYLTNQINGKSATTETYRQIAICLENSPTGYMANIHTARHIEIVKSIKDFSKLNGKLFFPSKKEIHEYIQKQYSNFKYGNIEKVFKDKKVSFLYDYAVECGVEPKIEGYIGGDTPKEYFQWFIDRNIETEKATKGLAMAIAKEQNRDIAIVWAELTGVEEFETYTTNLIDRLQKEGYSFEIVENNIYVQLGKKRKPLPIRKNSGHVFADAKIVIANLAEFADWFFEQYGDKDTKEQIKAQKAQREETRKLLASYDRASGVIEWIESEEEIEKMELAINQLRADYYLHTWGRGIDDFILFGVRTKGKRTQGELNSYVSHRYRLQDIKDTHKPFECWECGKEFNFWSITTDSRLPAWEAFKQRIEQFEDCYCGCDNG